MGESWYKKCMPQVGEIKPFLDKIGQEINGIYGVKKAYIFGSLAENINNPQIRIKDVDILVKTSFNSEDLIAINQNILSNKEEFLEEEGFDIEAVKFSKQFIKLKDGIDHWTISSDNKLLHWGPIISDIEEAKELKSDAEKFANKENNIKELNKISDSKRNNWYNSYESYINKEFKDMPSGWYQSDIQDIKEILNKAIQLK